MVASTWLALAFHRRQERVSFRFNGLGQQSARAASQDRHQRIIDRIGLTEETTVVMLVIGVSLLREVQAGFHPLRYAAFLTQTPF